MKEKRTTEQISSDIEKVFEDIMELESGTYKIKEQVLPLRVKQAHLLAEKLGAILERHITLNNLNDGLAVLEDNYKDLGTNRLRASEYKPDEVQELIYKLEFLIQVQSYLKGVKQ